MMNRTKIIICLILGLTASILMFCGDMLLYYSKDDYDRKNRWNSVMNIMKRESRWRLYLGGMLGPLTAFLYACSFYHMYLIANDDTSGIVGLISFLIAALGITFG